MDQSKMNFGTVELCLTYACNVKCANCSTLCTQAPAAHHLTPAQVQSFIGDSKANNHHWGMITLHGGEPSLNPCIYEIINILTQYRKEAGCILYLLSNNSSRKVQEIITRISIQHDIPLGISTKKEKNINGSGDPIQYVPINESPTDLDLEYSLGCEQSKTCGVCYNYLGYFPCSSMAAAARVFGYAPAALSIKDLTPEKCQEYFELHCKHCGFALKDRARVIDQVSTKTWVEKLVEYNFKVDFHRDSMQGQMHHTERKALYDTVVKYKPKIMIEIGTWKGGGSTYILACAAKEYGGHLFTIEVNPELYSDAINLFDTQLIPLKPSVSFYHGFSQDKVPFIISNLDKKEIDFILFDGADDADQTVLEFNMVTPFLKKGSLIAFHDWKTEKTRKVKDLITSEWKEIVSILDTETGFKMFVKEI